MEKVMKREAGFTLLEMLVALSILGIIFALVSNGLVNAMQVHRTHEAATASQAKLRRVTEVFTQELRSAVLGGISNQPYTTTNKSISFVLLDGGAGYQVLPHASGNNANFVNANKVQIAAAVGNAADLDLEEKYALLVNTSGQAVFFKVDDVDSVGGAGSTVFDIKHPGCKNTINFTSNTLLFKVRPVGFQFDAANGTLYEWQDGADRLPLAFDLKDLQLSYIYQRDDGTTVTKSAPILSGGLPARSVMDSGINVTLVRVELALSARGKGSNVERSYTGQVELAGSSNFNIQAVQPCS